MSDANTFYPRRGFRLDALRVARLLLASLLFLSPFASGADHSPNGSRLADFLDHTGVEQRWPAGVHVAWETGIPDGKPEKSAGKHTHCSAFVASIGKQLGIYILRPPEHSQVLLANAQYEWLESEGAQQGWRSVPGAIEAQAAANRGELVVATYRNHHDDKPGHIAIVRPSNKTRQDIAAEGPQITQAGGTNFLSTSLARGFAGHPAAWGKGEVRFYAHAIDWQKATVK